MYNKDNIKPAYYGGGEIGEIDVIDLAKMFHLNFNIGNIVKYVIRAGHKDPEKKIEDLEKAQEYLKREIEFLKENR